jgi:hypothetical protein
MLQILNNILGGWFNFVILKHFELNLPKEYLFILYNFQKENP